MIKKLFMFVFLLILAGCNSVYEYVFLPPQRVEYTLVPDKDAVVQLGDTSYFVSGDGISMGYDAKSWKIEIKYMSDYQLNKFEFPEESNDGEFSGNPYTYGNWIDPELDYTPRRFTVFKVTIYNYTGSKLNYDPELSVLQTDRGDNFNAYAREQKNSKFYSMEEYYQKRKGTSGVDDEIFETRMGIARRTMLYYGKPVYKGDSRDGLIVFNPIVDDIEKLKITVKDFVTGYDENNEPSEFQDFVFYFKQVPVKEQTLNELNAQYILDSDSSSVLKGKITVAQIEYKRQITSVGREVDVWNPIPIAIPSLLEYLEQKTTLNSTFITGTFTDEDVSAGTYKYRLKQIDYNGAFEYSDVIEIEVGTPSQYSLEQNYPNPFNPITTISYSIKEKGLVTLKVFDILGKEVATLTNEEQIAGSYKLDFNASALASGIYFYSLKAGDFVSTRKMILLK